MESLCVLREGLMSLINSISCTRQSNLLLHFFKTEEVINLCSFAAMLCLKEFEHEGSIPFLGTLITRCGNTLKTEVYRKPTDTGLLLHFQSHVDNRYKKGLVNTMVDLRTIYPPPKKPLLKNTTIYVPCF